MTVGQVLLNQALPEELRNYSAPWDKARVKEIFSWLAKNRPDQYRDVLHKLSQAGIESATFGRSSFTLDDLTPPKESIQLRQKINRDVQKLLDRRAPKEKIIEYIAKQSPILMSTVMDTAKKNKNAFYKQIISGARGNPNQISTLLGSDLLYLDHKNRPIANIPVIHNYSEGLTPWEYWASTYGARKGIVDLKLATRDAGAAGKQLGLTVHDLVVMDDNCKTENGLDVSSDDEDSVGAVLAVSAGPFRAGQVITPRVLASLRKDKVDNIVVRSVATCQADNGVCGICSGIREYGRFPKIGENVGLPSAQAVSEQISQGQISSKHTGGVVSASKGLSGFKAFDQMIQFPEFFIGGASLSKHDGTVQRIEKAPAGGSFVYIKGEQHYVPVDQEILVKPGQTVTRGDVLSDGVPNPAEVAAYRGLGNARTQFIKDFNNFIKQSGMTLNRRNTEIIARGLLRYVTLDEPVGNWLPGDVVDYSLLRKEWEPPEDSESLSPLDAVGYYAMAPIGQVEIGDRISKPLAQMLAKKYPDTAIKVRKEPPPFRPYVVRALDHIGSSENWLSRLGGSYLKRNILDSVGRGQVAPIRSPSYISSYAYGQEFGKDIEKSGLY